MKTSRLRNAFWSAGIAACLWMSGCDAAEKEEPTYSVEMSDLLELIKRASVCGDGSDFRSVASYYVSVGYLDSALRGYEGELIRCSVGAKSCAEFWRCSGVDVTTPCDPETTEETCVDGDSVQWCEEVSSTEAYLAVEHCPTVFDDPDQTCATTESGNAQCVQGECPAEHIDGSWCEGDVLTSCAEDRIRNKVDCSEYGLTCRQVIQSSDEFTSAMTFCGTGEACPSSPCLGDELIRCDGVTGEEIVSAADCGSVAPGFTCIVSDGYGACGLPEEKRECEDGEVACEGDVAKFCLGGKLFATDCSTFQNATCETGFSEYDSESAEVWCAAP